MATPACPRRAPLLLIPDGDVDELGDEDLGRYRRVTARWNAEWHPVDPAGPGGARARLWRRPLPGRRQIRPGRPM
jgi:hypothetical protein